MHYVRRSSGLVAVRSAGEGVSDSQGFAAWPLVTDGGRLWR
jgi:hypothetical protein